MIKRLFSAIYASASAKLVQRRVAACKPLSKAEFDALGALALHAYFRHYEHLDIGSGVTLGLAQLDAALRIGLIELKDGLINCQCGINLSLRNLKHLPYSFGRVGGDFFCADNQLTALDGAPTYVGGNFSCDDNNLTTLEGAPKFVGGYFSCCRNMLISLAGAPDSEVRIFSCSHNEVKFTGLPSGYKPPGSFYG